MFIPISAVLFFTETVFGGLGLGLEGAGLGLGLGLGTLVLTTRLFFVWRLVLARIEVSREPEVARRWGIASLVLSFIAISLGIIAVIFVVIIFGIGIFTIAGGSNDGEFHRAAVGMEIPMGIPMGMGMVCGDLLLTGVARPTVGPLPRHVCAGCGRWPGWSGGSR